VVLILLATVEASYWFCVAHDNGLAGAAPESGFIIREGGEAYLYHCEAFNNKPNGVGVHGALGTRTNQGRTEIYGGSYINNAQMGIVSGTVGNVVCENVEASGNPQGNIVAINGRQTPQAENIIDQSCIDEYPCMEGEPGADLSLSCPPQAGLLQGANIAPVPVTTSGGDGNYRYSIQPAGSGLSIDNNGLVTSSPLNTLGWLDYIVTVTDGSGASATCSSRFFVDAGDEPNPNIMITCPKEAGLLKGANIVPAPVMVSGGDEDYRYVITPTGSGLSIDNTGLGWCDLLVKVFCGCWQRS